MSEEIKNPNEITETQEVPTEEPQNQEPLALSVAVPTAVTMWNDDKLFVNAQRRGKALCLADLVPDLYKNNISNCLIALDFANRLGLSPLVIMQNLYMVKGKPGWSGAFCIAAINGSGRFTPLDYKFVGEPGTPSHGCYAIATRISNGAVCVSDTITMQMAQKEGWLNKPGSKWLTMPGQMMRYRAAAFFARVYCPDLLLGIPTYEEVQDVRGYEDADTKTTIVLDKKVE